MRGGPNSNPESSGQVTPLAMEPQPNENTRRRRRSAWLVFSAIVLGLAVTWGCLGVKFYQRVIPFYDSLSYQNGYDEVAQATQEQGVWRTLVSVWTQPNNNVVLYKFAAAVVGSVIPTAPVGLYVYLLAIHFFALVVLFTVTERNTGSLSAGLVAASAWLAAVPFAHLRNGIADQRMDLAAGSFCLLAAALALAWSRRPSRASACALGLVASLAMLHRPVMAVTICLIIVPFGIRAVVSHRTRSLSDWAKDIGWILLPGLVIAVPWFWMHARELRDYYFVRNVDFGNAASPATAAWYNLKIFWQAVGAIYLSIVAVAAISLIVRRRLIWADLGTTITAMMLPIAVLALSRSTGNVYVAQAGFGLPALVIACARRRPELPSSSRGESLGVGVGGLLLAGVIAVQTIALVRELNDLPVNAREGVERIVRAVSAIKSQPRLASFQDSPANVVAIARVAHELGTPLEIGTYAYHPPEFGLPNKPLATVTVEETRQAAARMVESMIVNDDILLLPSADTERLLLPEPFSHRVIPQIRALVKNNPRFHRERSVGPVGKIQFEVFSIRRR